MSKIQFLDSQAAFALHTRQFFDRLSDQIEDALQHSGLELHAKTTGIVQLLYQEGPCSVGRIAEMLRFSHQLATQRLAWLIDKKFAETKPDPDDRRRRSVCLTEAGIREAEKLQNFIPQLSRAYTHLFAETGLDLDLVIKEADAALKDLPLIERFPGGSTTRDQG